MPKPGRKNQHNGRHENGLVGPGKRITKQKSNGHINGSARGATTDEATPSTSNALFNGQAPNGTSAYATDTKKDTLLDPRSNLKQQDSEASIEGLDNMTNGNAQQNGSIDGKHRKSDALPPKAKSAYDINPIYLASTILRSCPGTDTVALLIFLMALPTMMLTIVQAFFASLTFMPPKWIHTRNFVVLSRPFPESRRSTFLCHYHLCGWHMLRTVVLSMGLGSQICSRPGADTDCSHAWRGQFRQEQRAVNGICVAMVLLVHLVRSRGVRDFFVGNMLYAKLNAYPSVANVLQYLPSQADFGDSLETPSTVRSIIAVHIIAQALMSYARRSLTNTSGTTTAKSSKRN